MTRIATSLAPACALVLLFFPRPSSAQPPAAAAGDLLKTLRKGHPRLILTDERLAELKALSRTDETLARCVRSVLAEADRYCKRRPPVYRKVGPRLLGVSRDCLRRTYALGLAWRWTGKKAYAEAARDNLLAVCAFKDWNPSHFLDTAEMAHAVGLGYDWLHGWLDAASREKIRSGLIRLGLTPGLIAYSGKARYGWWRRCSHNWNQVCNGGLIVAALALAETDAETARTIVSAALTSLPRALATYAPDGAWPEGPGYWHYATRYTTYALAALDSALGRDFGLSKAKGLEHTALFPIHLAGPKHRYFAFADSGHSYRPMACQFWLARRFRLPVVAAREHELIARYGGDALHVIWYVPRPKAPPPALPLRRYFRGPVEVVVMRSAWGDPDALFVGVKAGTNRANHAHLDLGSFELDALGVRWAVDLGGDNYNLPGYWDTRRGGRRWKIYRLGSLSHNVPLLNDQHQDPYAAAKVLKAHLPNAAPKAPGDPPRTVIDLTAAYKPLARKVLRGVMMLPDSRAVLIQDEFDLARPCGVAWGMTTQAEISADGARAVLAQGGRELVAQILSPPGARFTVESAEQKPPQRTNTGVRRLLIRLPPPHPAPLRLAILLAPTRPGPRQKPSAPPRILPLKDW